MPEQSTSLITPHEPHRFAALDALRGIAAFAVIGFHISTSAFPHGYLAVDFFFLLSGFVVTFAYQSKLDAGRVSSFARARIIRLYPLYLLGTLLGLALAIAKHMLRFPYFSLKEISLATLFGLFLLPTLYPADGLAVIFPFDSPAWSLFDEVIANICHALFFRLRGVRVLGVVIGVLGLALIYAASTRRYLADGYQQNTALWGIIRCIFSYSVGMGLCLFSKRKRPAQALPFALSLLLLAASFFISHSFRANSFIDLSLIAAVYPCLLWFSIGTSVPTVMRPMVAVLAESSYAIYIMHMPLLGILDLVWNRLSHHRAPTVWIEVTFVIAITAAAIAADHIYDRPVRRALADFCGDRDRSPGTRNGIIAKAG